MSSPSLTMLFKTFVVKPHYACPRLTTASPVLLRPVAATSTATSTKLLQEPAVLSPVDTLVPPIDTHVSRLESTFESRESSPAPVPEKDWSGYVDLLACAVLLGGCEQDTKT